jgi:hypothetical protein
MTSAKLRPWKRAWSPREPPRGLLGPITGGRSSTLGIALAVPRVSDNRRLLSKFGANLKNLTPAQQDTSEWKAPFRVHGLGESTGSSPLD